MKQLFALSLLMLSIGCAGPCNSHPWTLYLLAPIVVFDPQTYLTFDPRTHRHYDGSSMENAIILNGPKGDEAARKAECAYIQQNFKVDTIISFQQQRVVGGDHKKYDLINFTREQGKMMSVWFDVTDALHEQS